eukprot:6676873-Pyramimonas_sp.AAC.1
MNLVLNAGAGRKRKKRKRGPDRPPLHPPANDPLHQQCLQQRLIDSDNNTSTDERSNSIGKAFVQAHEDYNEYQDTPIQHHTREDTHTADQKLRELIEQRRSTPHTDATTRTTLSKLISKQLRL